MTTSDNTLIGSWIKFVLLGIALLSFSTQLCDARHSDSRQELPPCISDRTACGYVQLNGFGGGKQQLCECKDDQSCPISFYPFDSYTIMHGLDQYKFCTTAPKLKPCYDGEVAFTTYRETSLTTYEVLVDAHQVHCLCPAKYLLVRNSTKYDEFNNLVSVLATSSICKPPPLCQNGDTCRAITKSSESSFVTQNCRCPLGMYCPMDIKYASNRIDLDKGSYYTMQCM